MAEENSQWSSNTIKIECPLGSQLGPSLAPSWFLDRLVQRLSRRDNKKYVQSSIYVLLSQCYVTAAAKCVTAMSTDAACHMDPRPRRWGNLTYGSVDESRVRRQYQRFCILLIGQDAIGEHPSHHCLSVVFDKLQL